MKNTIYLYTIIFLAALSSQAQDCELNIPAGNWQGATTQGADGTSSTANVQVTLNDQNVSISDFSAGLFASYGDHTDYSRTLAFDCDSQLVSQEFSSDYGTIELVSGSWDSSTQTLTINWSVPASQISETTTLTYSGQ